jgi:hypothetical protein
MSKEIKEYDEDFKGKGFNEPLRYNLNSSDIFQPIQKNTKLLKFILYTTKIEIKTNSFMRMIYGVSILEIMLWTVLLLLFFISPSNYYLVWILIFHLGRGILGIILINKFPKTYEILDNLSKNPNFEESKILEMVEQQINETFSTRFADNRVFLIVYLIFSSISLVVDFIIFFVQLFANSATYPLIQISFMFIITIFIGNFN